MSTPNNLCVLPPTKLKYQDILRGEGSKKGQPWLIVKLNKKDFKNLSYKDDKADEYRLHKFHLVIPSNVVKFDDDMGLNISIYAICPKSNIDKRTYNSIIKKALFYECVLTFNNGGFPSKRTSYVLKTFFSIEEAIHFVQEIFKRNQAKWLAVFSQFIAIRSDVYGGYQFPDDEEEEEQESESFDLTEEQEEELERLENFKDVKKDFPLIYREGIVPCLMEAQKLSSPEFVRQILSRIGNLYSKEKTTVDYSNDLRDFILEGLAPQDSKEVCEKVISLVEASSLQRPPVKVITKKEKIQKEVEREERRGSLYRSIYINEHWTGKERIKGTWSSDQRTDHQQSPSENTIETFELMEVYFSPESSKDGRTYMYERHPVLYLCGDRSPEMKREPSIEEIREKGKKFVVIYGFLGLLLEEMEVVSEHATYEEAKKALIDLAFINTATLEEQLEPTKKVSKINSNHSWLRWE